MAPARPHRSRRLILGGIAALAAVAVLLSAAIGRQPATPEAGPDRIAIVEPSGAIAIVDRAGTSIQRFVVDGTAFRFPAFSPDGSLLAAVGADADRSGVFVFDADAGRDAEVPPTAVFASDTSGVIYLSWAPDGDRISFLTGEADTLALRIVPADASEPDTVVRRGQPLYWDWIDPDRILVHTGGSGPAAFLGEVDLDGEPVGPAPQAPGTFQAPGVSFSGTYRSYAALGPAGARALVMERRDGAGRQAVDGGLAVSFGWSPNAEVLAFVDGGGAAGIALGPLRVADAMSGETRTLIDAAVAAFFWSPDGSSIAAITISAHEDGNVASASVAAAPAIEIHLVIVDVAGGSTRLERVVALGDLFLTQFLPFYDQYAKSHRIWAPDSSAVVLPLVDVNGVARMTVVRVDGGPDVDIGPGILGFWSP